MTRRTLAINWGDNLFVSQEFNGDRKEAQMFGVKGAKPFWEDVVKKFKGVRTVRAFERALEEVEQMYGYEHIPLVYQSDTPKTEETWKMADGELELWTEYGNPVLVTA